MDDSDSIFDTTFSWIENTERRTRVHESYSKTNPTTIVVNIIYINIDSYISDISKESYTFDCDKNESRITENDLIRLIQTNKSSTTSTSKYRLTDILLYNVTIEPENIQSYINSDDSESTSFINTVSLISRDILIPPSISVFHDTNCLYLIYNEVVSSSTNPVSVLCDGTRIPSQRKTKRVKFVSEIKMRNTRRV